MYSSREGQLGGWEWAYCCRASKNAANIGIMHMSQRKQLFGRRDQIRIWGILNGLITPEGRGMSKAHWQAWVSWFFPKASGIISKIVADELDIESVNKAMVMWLEVTCGDMISWAT